MMAAMKGIINALVPTTINQACMWSEPDLVGWLEKRGGKFTSWKKRFFVLQQSYLFYFDDDLKVQEKVPLGVIPLDSCRVELRQDDTSRTAKKFTFHIYLGKQFVGYSKRDTYIVAAPSHQALDEWVQRLQIAANSRESLLDQLRKARWRGADIRKMLASSYGNQEILHFAATKPEGQALTAEITKVQDGIGKLEGEVAQLEAQANQQEGALMRAIVVWDILDHYLSGKARSGEPTPACERIRIESEAIQQLYGLLQAKASYFHGHNIENLLKQERDKLKVKVQNSLYVVQERQAKIRSTAPRYSFNLDPKIFEDEGESLQQQFEPDVEENRSAALKLYDSIQSSKLYDSIQSTKLYDSIQPSKLYENLQPLKIYDNIRSEVMETAEQLKALKTTAMKVKEISGKVKDCMSPAMSVLGMVANSNMLTDMMKKRSSSKDSAGEGTSGSNTSEGNASGWDQGSYQGETSSMPSQPRPIGTTGLPPQASFGQMHYGGPAAYAQSPAEYSGAKGPTSPPQTRAMAPTRFPGAAQSNTQPPHNQQPGPYSQGFVPRGFQQQMSSMPHPPMPQAVMSFQGPGSTAPAMGTNSPGRSPGAVMPQQGGPMQQPMQGRMPQMGGSMQPMQPMQGRMPQPGAPMQPMQGRMPQPGAPMQPMQGRMPQTGAPVQPMQGRMPQPGAPMQPMQGKMPQPGAPMQPMQGKMPQPGAPMQPMQGKMPQPGAPMQPMQGKMPQPGAPMQPMQGKMPQPGAPMQPMQGKMPQPGAPMQQPMQGRMPQPGAPMQQPMQGRMPQPGAPMPPMQGRMPQPGAPMQTMQGRMPQPGAPMQPIQGRMAQTGGPMQPIQGRMPQPGGPMQPQPMQLRMPTTQQGAMPPMQRGQQPTWPQMPPMQFPRPR